MLILGIDPGYERLGVAIVEKTKGKETLVYSSCFQTSAKEKHPERLKQLGQEIEKIIDQFKPNVLAIETLFFQNNQKTAMKVAEVRGLIIYLAQVAGLTVREFTPMEIKVAVTGYGKSDKKQVIGMVEKLVKINKSIKHDDEYDAIASALTAFAIHS